MAGYEPEGEMIKNPAQKVVDRMSEETLTEKDTGSFFDGAKGGKYDKPAKQLKSPGEDPKHRFYRSSPTMNPDKKPTKPTPQRQTGDKAKDMATWAKANPTLVKTKTPNPLMKNFYTGKPDMAAVRAKAKADTLSRSRLGEETQDLQELPIIPVAAGAAALGGAAYLTNKAKKAADTHSDKSIGKPTIQGAASALRKRNQMLQQLSNEELSIDDQMKISQKYNRMTPEEKKKANKKVMGKVKKVKREKDTRTDAEKMADATGPRKGSNYRGD